ncbi:hypothetical protein BASA50_002701 [Batrachochytrium salamandrivorans]|uniref:Smr domain-containing protein n=1 Tax=Batrachochytrium salamandrivorans TaxID=1357716 RepID=A0ABQ8FKM1_9FUNG|nr:hypothetical protein BASA62_008212 [Batrachochytrium salamandrivorans]KAH6573332.1 hypothetical protein BASA60_006106 [Batrachochytrium salamandrivorans]KAH6579749.1 hypothetical protein BASA61_010059 [Batrachochytrium salamandrivorans]KAH6599872.1 hypothetical protein BASA50_002701 [Batrachochytrium salamandrivorans]KAJ1334318.1 hypothetical protein BSLG_008153 [Batrachochytrium salamandrivorans]
MPEEHSTATGKFLHHCRLPPPPPLLPSSQQQSVQQPSLQQHQSDSTNGNHSDCHTQALTFLASLFPDLAHTPLLENALRRYGVCDIQSSVMELLKHASVEAPFASSSESASASASASALSESVDVAERKQQQHPRPKLQLSLSNRSSHSNSNSRSNSCSCFSHTDTRSTDTTCCTANSSVDGGSEYCTWSELEDLEEHGFHGLNDQSGHSDCAPEDIAAALGRSVAGLTTVDGHNHNHNHSHDDYNHNDHNHELLLNLVAAFPEIAESDILDSLQMAGWDAAVAADRLLALQLAQTHNDNYNNRHDNERKQQHISLPPSCNNKPLTNQDCSADVAVTLQVILPRAARNLAEQQSRKINYSKQNQPFHPHPSMVNPDTVSNNSTAHISLGNSKGSSRKQKKKHGQARNSQRIPNSHQAKLQTTPGDESAHIAIKDTMDMTKAQSVLAEIFPQFHMETLTDTLAAHNGDVDKAATALTKWAEEAETITRKPKAFQMGSPAATALAHLKDLFPNISTHTISAVLSENNNDVAEAAEVLISATATAAAVSTVGGLPKERHRSLIITPRSRFDSPDWTKVSSKSPIRACARTAIRGDGNTTVADPPDTKYVFTRQSVHGKSDFHNTDHDGPDALRQRAQEYLEMRNSSFLQASQAFKRGSITGRGSAAFYADRGHALSACMKATNDRAAQAQLDLNRIKNGHDINVLDLHGLVTSEAKQAAMEYANEWANIKTSSRRLKIITGAGNHSVDGRARLYHSVWAHLVRQGWSIESGGNGWFFVCK